MREGPWRGKPNAELITYFSQARLTNVRVLETIRDWRGAITIGLRNSEGHEDAAVQYRHQIDFNPARRRHGMGSLALALLASATLSGLITPVPAQAQKYPGITLPDAPAVPRRAPVAPPRVAPPSPFAERAPPSAPVPQGNDPDARALADRLPLDPATANLEGRLPADVPATIRSLGLRVPQGARSDRRSRSPSVREFIDALRH